MKSKNNSVVQNSDNDDITSLISAEINRIYREWINSPVPEKLLEAEKCMIEESYGPLTVFDKYIDAYIDNFYLPLLDSILQSISDIRLENNIPFDTSDESLSSIINDLTKKEFESANNGAYRISLRHVHYSTGDIAEYKDKELRNKHKNYSNEIPERLFNVVSEKITIAVVKTNLKIRNKMKEDLKALNFIQSPHVFEESNVEKKMEKIFISHSSKDARIVEEIIELLESIGVEPGQIFCTSFEGKGIDLGENFLDVIKDELSLDSLVLFVLSENFYKSPVCMCEMGAAWVLSKSHIPLLVPPLSYNDIKGVVPLTQGMILTSAEKLNSFKEKIERSFDIKKKLNFSDWERKRERLLKQLQQIID